jgi:hypothetical protein
MLEVRHGGSVVKVAAIALWQPWASLIFSGIKRHETRSFALPDRLIGEVVAIHAAKRHVRRIEPELLLQAGPDLPRGAILGVVRFGTPVRTEDAKPADVLDLLAGDWTAGRWAWPVVLAQRLDEPVPAVGRQGWWSVELEGVRI